MRRTDGEVVAGWGALALGELWFARQGFTTHDAGQLALEVGGLLLFGVCQARLLPEGPARSPLWAGVFAVSWTAMNLGPSGFTGLVYWVGVIVLATALVVRLERARRWGLLAGVLVGLLGAVLARVQVLSRAAEGGDGRQSSVTRSVRAQLQEELVAPLRAGPPAPRHDGPPIVLITVDTLRADAAVKMRSYQRLAARGASWPRAMSTSSWTVPAMGSLFTGLLPAEHGAGVSAAGTFQGLSAQAPTLAGVLSGAGYQTVGIATNAWLTSGLGFPRGFDVYWHADERFHHRLALAGFPNGPKGHEGEAVVDRALGWLEAAPARGWFLWVHLIDPHLPYLHVEGSLERGLSDERLRAGMRLDEGVEASVRAAYQAEVDYADAQLGRLLDALEARGVLDQGVVALTADHGEELWDHGATGHGHQQHTEVVDVALALVAPGAVGGERSDLASLIDLPSTLAAVAGAQIGVGEDLRALTSEDRVVVAQGSAYFHQQRSARWREWRAIVETAGDGPLWCFDRAADPGERQRLQCPGGLPVGEAALRVAAPGAGGVESAVPGEALKALGYVE